MSLVLGKKRIQLSGSVIFGVVQDEKNRPMSKLEQITKKLMKGLGIESRSCLGHQLARCQIYCSKETIFSRVEAESTRGCFPLGAQVRVRVLAL